jgi:hypothetical protein
VAGSLKRGHVTASLLISKLQATPRQNALTRALQEYGRVAKTLFILRYLGSAAAGSRAIEQGGGVARRPVGPARARLNIATRIKCDSRMAWTPSS